MISKSMRFLREVFLDDFDEEGYAKVIHVEGAEKGLDHLAIYTQTRTQKEAGIAMRHKIYSEEVIFPIPSKARLAEMEATDDRD